MTRPAMLALAALSLAAARADSPTPFVDTPAYKVGETYTEPAAVVFLGGGRYLVLVETDTKEHVLLNATAKKGVVPDELLGRAGVRVEAKVLAKPKGGDTDDHLEILSVKPAK